MHGTSGTTGSEGCLLLYSVVGNSLIFPIPLCYFTNLKPGSRAASPGAHVRHRVGHVRPACGPCWRLRLHAGRRVLASQRLCRLFVEFGLTVWAHVVDGRSKLSWNFRGMPCSTTQFSPA